MRDLAWLEWPLIWLAVAVGATGIAWAVAWGVTIENRTAMEHGYEALVKQIPGRTETFTDYIKKEKVQTAPERTD